jgi:hypothetical protein
MLAFISRISREQIDVPLRRQSVSVCLLMSFQEKLKLNKILAWGERDMQRKYKYRIPVAVGRALHQEMQDYPLNDYQRLLLRQIDKAIVDYRTPLSQRLILLSLPAYA